VPEGFRQDILDQALETAITRPRATVIPMSTASLVIPAVVAFFFTDRFGVALVIAWASGTVAIVGGIGASFYWDLATGPLLVCAFGLVLVIAMMLRPFLGVHPGAKIYVKALQEEEQAEG